MNRLAVVALVTALFVNSPVFADDACAPQGTVERHFDQAVSGFHALALREMLGLSAICGGRRVVNVFVWASTRSNGQGRVRLIVNNEFQGEPLTVNSSEPQRYEFSLNTSNNALDIDIRTLELQVEGDLLVTGLGAVLDGGTSGTESSVSNSTSASERLTFLGASHHARPGASATTLDLSPRDGRFHALLAKATGGDYRVERLIVRFGDGSTRNYIGFDLKEGEAHRIDFEGVDPVQGIYLSSINVLGGSSSEGQIQFSGIGEGRSDSP